MRYTALAFCALSAFGLCFTITSSAPAAAPAATENHRAGESVEQGAPREAAGDQGTAGDFAARPQDLPDELVRLREKVQQVLDQYYARSFSTKETSPWSIMHWSIAYGVDAQVRLTGAQEEYASAIGWLCYNYPCRSQELMHLTNGQMSLPIAPGVQGHQGQFLSMLAQSRVKPAFPLKIGQRDLTVADLVEHEKRTCRAGTELTFKLIGLSHYLSSEETWKCQAGQQWSVGRLLTEELKQPIRSGACCGGTHRLMGLSCAVHRRQTAGLPVDGPWLLAEQRVVGYQQRALRMQNADGSFSTNWFREPGNWGGNERKLNTSGHTLEWLAFSLPEERLRHHQVVHAVSFLTELLLTNAQTKWHAGALGHGLHALAIYERRVFGVQPGDRRRKWNDGLQVAAFAGEGN